MHYKSLRLDNACCWEPYGYGESSCFSCGKFEFNIQNISIGDNFTRSPTVCRPASDKPLYERKERFSSSDDSHGQARGVLLSSVGYDRTPRGLWDESINLFRAGLFLPSAPLSALRPRRMEARHQQKDSSKWKRQPALGASSVSQGYCLQWLRYIVMRRSWCRCSYKIIATETHDFNHGFPSRTLLSIRYVFLVLTRTNFL